MINENELTRLVEMLRNTFVDCWLRESIHERNKTEMCEATPWLELEVGRAVPMEARI